MTMLRSEADRYRPSVQRRDRRWELHMGGKRFAIVFSDHRSSASVASFQVLRRNAGLRPAPKLSITKAVGIVLGLLGGVATIGIAIQSGPADAGTASYVVSVPVPEARAVMAVPSRSPVRPRAATSISSTPATAARAPAPEAQVRIYDDHLADDGAGQLPTRQAALAAAMTTGSLQQWIRPDGNERGFIVAGPAENGCRDLSILVRRFGEDDRVEKSRECGRLAAN